MAGYFDNGHARVGKKDIPFSQIVVQKQFRIWVPESFKEDSNLDYRYTYLSNMSKSPLGIAFRFTPVSKGELREKMIANYFGQGGECTRLEGNHSHISYRESVNAGSFMSVYSMRVAIDIADGVIFGCFNCSTEYKDDWKPAVLEMLKSVEEV